MATHNTTQKGAHIVVDMEQYIKGQFAVALAKRVDADLTALAAADLEQQKAAGLRHTTKRRQSKAPHSRRNGAPRRWAGWSASTNGGEQDPSRARAYPQTALE